MQSVISQILNTTNIYQLLINSILLGVIAVTDMRYRKIPNILIGVLVVINIVVLFFLENNHLILHRFLISIGITVLLFVFYLVTKQIGAGDVKLIAGLYFCYSVYLSTFVILNTILLSIIYMLIINRNKTSAIILGPFFFAGHIFLLLIFLLIKIFNFT